MKNDPRLVSFSAETPKSNRFRVASSSYLCCFRNKGADRNHNLKMSDSGCFTLSSEAEDGRTEVSSTLTFPKENLLQIPESKFSQPKQKRQSRLQIDFGSLPLSLRNAISQMKHRQFKPEVEVKEPDLDDLETEVASTISNLSDLEEAVEKQPELDNDSEDSGVHLPVTTTTSSDEDEVEVIPSATCSSNCHCSKLKSWICSQAVKTRNIIEADAYYQENKDSIWSAKTLKDRSQCNFDPYPTLSGESYRYAGERDRFGRIHGRGAIYFPNGRKFLGLFSHGVRSGDGLLAIHAQRLVGRLAVARTDRGRE